MYESMAVLAGFIFLYSMFSGWLKTMPISGPMLFTTVGLALGPFGLGILDLQIEREGISSIAELALALVLFTDAANADLTVLKHSYRIPWRLLMVGLPLTILLGFGVGILLFGQLTLLEIAILATMLAPTDAALGSAVVTNKLVPAEIREGLNVESGLNDGICVPILVLFLTLASASAAARSTMMFVAKRFVRQIGIGVVVGIVITLVGRWLFEKSSHQEWVTETWQFLPLIALAVTCFAIAQQLGGSGFIACFTGGLLFGSLAEPHKDVVKLAAEGAGQTFSLVTWMTFGAVVVGKLFSYFSWEAALYAALSLTLVRMAPVFLSLNGLNLQASEKLFMGWFGPRGLASIVFAVMVINEQLPGGDTITVTVVCTIVLSIFAHGFSANPLVAALSKRLKASEDK